MHSVQTALETLRALAATPTVAGVASLILGVNPRLTARDVKYILAVTARQADGSSDTDTIDVLVRNARERPKPAPALALGRDVHSVRSWPSHGIPGGRLGPNANGRKW